MPKTQNMTSTLISAIFDGLELICYAKAFYLPPYTFNACCFNGLGQ